MASKDGRSGNTNTTQHGIYANRFLNDEERTLFRKIKADFLREFELNQSSDQVQVDIVIVNLLKILRAAKEVKVKPIIKFDRILRSYLKDLKSSRVVRDDPQSQMDPTWRTYDEWVQFQIEAINKRYPDGIPDDY